MSQANPTAISQQADNHPPTLLAIVAHPDDESFGPGGTLARYAAEGVDVHICVATDGAAGSYDPDVIVGYESLAHRRSEELQNAVRVLGATLHTLSYGDSGMENSPANENPHCLFQAPLDDVAERIARLIREVRPHVVLTHDPTGGYFHPDHIKVNQAVNLAWQRSGDPAAYPDQGLAPWQPQRLYWTAMPRTWLRFFIRTLRLFRRDPTRFGRNHDIDLTRLGTPDDDIHCRVDVSAYLETKNEASRQHVSQLGGGPPWRFLPGFITRRMFRYETFTQAHPASPRPAHDLFEGLR